MLLHQVIKHVADAGQAKEEVQALVFVCSQLAPHCRVEQTSGLPVAAVEGVIGLVIVQLLVEAALEVWVDFSDVGKER